MNLTATTHSLELVTSSTAPTDWIVDFVDIDKSSATSVLPGSAQGSVSSATDTTIVSAPGSSVYRTVKHIAVRNKDASATQTITIQKDVSGTEYEVAEATLSAGESWEWTPEFGSRVLDAQGRVLFVERATANVTNVLNVVTLASDVVNNNGVANTIADVTALSFAVTAGETYWFEFVIPYTSAATTTGSRWSINGPAAPTMLNYRSEYTLAATTTTVNSATAYDIPAASNATSLTAGNVATVWGIIKPSGNGTVIARFASEVAGSAITAKAGATLRWMRVL